MKRDWLSIPAVSRLVLRCFGILGGIIGVSIIVMMFPAVLSIWPRNFDLLAVAEFFIHFLVLLIPFLVGGYLVWIAYLLVWRFSVRAIKAISTVSALVFGGWIIKPWYEGQKGLLPHGREFDTMLFIMLILIVALLFYHALVYVLTTLTDAPQEPETKPEKEVPAA
ncbi:MAG: hypothetical protein V1918_06160 [Planctomycetota bacterium]